MANRTLIPADAELWRRTGHAIPTTAAFINACAHDCNELQWPQAAEACTEVGADDEWSPLSWRETLLFWAGAMAPVVLVGLAVLGAIYWPH